MTATNTRTTTTTAKATGVSTTRKATKSERVETAKALTATQQKQLDALVSAAKAGISQAESGEQSLAGIMQGIADGKVFAARALARLSAHPAVVATGGPTKGQPALTKMAALIGRSDTSLTVYWKGAKALIGAKMANRTGTPTQAERDLVMAGFKSESARVSSYSAKGKGKGKGGKPTGTKGTTVTVNTIDGQLDAVLESVQRFTADNGFSAEELETLTAKLDAIHDALETASAK